MCTGILYHLHYQIFLHIDYYYLAPLLNKFDNQAIMSNFQRKAKYCSSSLWKRSITYKVQHFDKIGHHIWVIVWGDFHAKTTSYNCCHMIRVISHNVVGFCGVLPIFNGWYLSQTNSRISRQGSYSDSVKM